MMRPEVMVNQIQQLIKWRLNRIKYSLGEHTDVNWLRRVGLSEKFFAHFFVEEVIDVYLYRR